MHGVNLDLLRTGPYHPDGRAKDPHAHHRSDNLALRRAALHDLWHKRLARLRRLFSRQAQPTAQACPQHEL
jgi:hypothetical protein